MEEKKVAILMQVGGQHGGEGRKMVIKFTYSWNTVDYLLFTSFLVGYKIASRKTSFWGFWRHQHNSIRLN